MFLYKVLTVFISLAAGLQCSNFNDDRWFCPNGETVSLKSILRNKYVTNHQLKNAIENACRKTMSGYCGQKTFLQIFKEGDCSVPRGTPRGNMEFEAACKTHDTCYSMQRGQRTCDQEFCSNLKNSCDWLNKGWSSWTSCQTGAYSFYQAVNQFGSRAYRKSTC